MEGRKGEKRGGGDGLAAAAAAAVTEGADWLLPLRWLNLEPERGCVQMIRLLSREQGWRI